MLGAACCVNACSAQESNSAAAEDVSHQGGATTQSGKGNSVGGTDALGSNNGTLGHDSTGLSGTQPVRDTTVYPIAPATGGSPMVPNGSGSASSNGGAGNGSAPANGSAAAPANGGTPFATSIGPVAAPCDAYTRSSEIGTLFPEANGISGIVASRDQPGVYYVHSDRQKILYAIDKTGRLLGQWELTTNSAYFYTYNWEDISVQSVDGGPDKIWVGDIGNNFVRGGGDPRTSIKILSLVEPTIDPTQVVNTKIQVVDNLEYTYPDGLHDAEGMAMDPLTGDLYVFSKEQESPSKIFRAKAPLSGGVFEQVGTMDATNLNAADFSPSGRELLVRDYMQVFYWSRPADKTWLDVLAGTPPSKKVRLQWTDGFYGEAICFSADESGFLTVSEQEEGLTGSPVEFYAKTCK